MNAFEKHIADTLNSSIHAMRAIAEFIPQQEREIEKLIQNVPPDKRNYLIGKLNELRNIMRDIQLPTPGTLSKESRIDNINSLEKLRNLQSELQTFIAK